LENRGSEDDKVPRGMWQAVETGSEKVRLGKAERRGSKGRSRKKARGEG